MHVNRNTHLGIIPQVPVLPFARYRLRFNSSGTARPHAYTGSAWRGALGHALKQVVCVTHLPACPPCLLYRSCPYPYIFETPPPLGAQKMRKYTAAPHPFLLEPPREPENDVHEVGLTLIGRGNGYLPYLIYALQRAGEQGLGKGRAPMLLIDVRQADPVQSDTWTPVYQPDGQLRASPPGVPDVPPAPPAVRLRFETPVRLQRDDRLVTPDTFHFSDLFGPLLRRVSMLTYFHTDAPLETDFAGLMELARGVELAGAKLSWKDWTRYSSRQKTEMQMGGLVGEIELEMPEGSPLWPYLWLGQWLHVGKGTSMGLGHYTIQPASLPNL
ncbi:MAG: CRISPR system precrRNA processing endoribonuclease RAMP protein Cas6 [Acidobacteria bacterium]|nr:CRISPR system precrRNA processing endoribonuclease RAMP protein Cas6 [Acidobacteriota bacterium]